MSSYETRIDYGHRAQNQTLNEYKCHVSSSKGSRSCSCTVAAIRLSLQFMLSSNTNKTRYEMGMDSCNRASKPPPGKNLHNATDPARLPQSVPPHYRKQRRFLNEQYKNLLSSYETRIDYGDRAQNQTLNE